MKPQQKTAGEISLLNFILSHEKTSTAEIVKINNKLLADGLIPKGYPLREKSKGYDDKVYLPCNLDFFSVGELILIS